jgi:Type IV secretion-system coupling protein DNA-binding domain
MFGDALHQRAQALRDEKRRLLEAQHPQLKGLPAPIAVPLPQRADAIVLGRDDFGRVCPLPTLPRLEHMHVIGATGSGKTNFLEHCIRQDIAHGRGVCVVDPHGNHPGSLYRSLLSWLVQKGYDKRRVIHLIDPNAPSHTIGFNPLARGGAETRFSVIAEAMFEAFERMWGDEDGNSKPTIQRVMTATFTALGELGLTLAETRLLFDPEDCNGVRSLVLSKLEDSYAYDEIDWLHRISGEKTGRRDFRAEVVGPLNRIAKLVRTEAVRTIVGQSDRLIDLREALDEGHIILANLSGGEHVYEQGADLLGRLLTRFLFFHARRRHKPHVPYFVYLDECHRYLSGDVPNLLAEVRKYGLGLVLAHQWLAQLGRRDDPIREALCKGPNLRAVFRIKDPVEAAELAEMTIPLDLEMPVRQLVRPTVIGHLRTLFRNASTGRQSSTTTTMGSSTADTVTEIEMDSVSHTEGESSSETYMETEGESYAESFSETEGESYSGSLSSTLSSSLAVDRSEGESRGASESRGS